MNIWTQKTSFSRTLSVRPSRSKWNWVSTGGEREEAGEIFEIFWKFFEILENSWFSPWSNEAASMSVSVTIRVLHEPLVRLRTASALVLSLCWMLKLFWFFFEILEISWFSQKFIWCLNELVPRVRFRTTSHFVDSAWVLRGRIRKLTRWGDHLAFEKEPLFYQNVFAYLGTSHWSSSLLFDLLDSMAVIDVGIGLCWCKYFHFFVPLFEFSFSFSIFLHG